MREMRDAMAIDLLHVGDAIRVAVVVRVVAVGRVDLGIRAAHEADLHREHARLIRLQSERRHVHQRADALGARAVCGRRLRSRGRGWRGLFKPLFGNGGAPLHLAHVAEILVELPLVRRADALLERA